MNRPLPTRVVGGVGAGLPIFLATRLRLLFCVQSFEDLLGKRLLDLIVSWDRFSDSVLRVHPNGVITPFALEKTARDTKASLQIPALHPTRIFS